jgi:hypothetical protein
MPSIFRALNIMVASKLYLQEYSTYATETWSPLAMLSRSLLRFSAIPSVYICSIHIHLHLHGNPYRIAKGLKASSSLHKICGAHSSQMAGMRSLTHESLVLHKTSAEQYQPRCNHPQWLLTTSVPASNCPLNCTPIYLSAQQTFFPLNWSVHNSSGWKNEKLLNLKPSKLDIKP